MSLTDTSRNGAALPAPSIAPAVKAALPRRRRPGLIAAGVVILVLGCLGAYAFARAAGTNEPMLAVTTTITAGHQITDADLKVVQVNAASGLTPIPSTQRNTVVGKYAKVELVAGTLLTNEQLTTTAVPAAGQQLIGLELKPAQLPSRPLRPGEPVLLVITSDPRNVTLDGGKKATSADLPSPPTVAATVAGVGAKATDDTVVVDVVVPEANGPGLLERASQGRVAVALVAR
ncbi:SAF domain-containing protein [Krasilnikovia cinnamomea]|uniref:SAF domain-containing protein n=1 Tax=Krasilnikovia cinnamomea TaxID=349313 RepID=A0A4Q7Z7Z7_9ACTN|nr:SAF domain-containing protein [Krasilnikovia cinnamomea]RZU46642.1 SAF domain-containing protein [Krasilnikovia cinnamomea]